MTVTGLYINDTGHDQNEEDERVPHFELHPAYKLLYKGVTYYSGKRNAGSPVTMNPSGVKPKGTGGIAWRYCWYETGAPCLDYDGNDTFR